jgi:hypothetical protein
MPRDKSWVPLGFLEPGQWFKTAESGIVGRVEYHTMAGTTVTFKRKRADSVGVVGGGHKNEGKEIRIPRTNERTQISSGTDVVPIDPTEKTPADTPSTTHDAGDGEEDQMAGGKKATIGGLIKSMLKNGRKPEAILEAVKAKFPDAKTTANSIAFYRAQLRKAGEIAKAGKAPKAAKPAKASKAKAAPATTDDEHRDDL